MLNHVIGLLTVGIAYSYIKFYERTRKYSLEKPDPFRKAVLCAVACFCCNVILGAAAGNNLQVPELLILFLIMLISDVDILINKIPTELIILLILGFGFIRIPEIKQLPDPAVVLLAGIGLYCFRKKIGIAVYDILLFVFLGIFVYPSSVQIKYASIFLILWGTAGSAMKFLEKNAKKIPLSPFIFLSYFICHGWGRL